jgi:hypothetical protein
MSRVNYINGWLPVVSNELSVTLGFKKMIQSLPCSGVGQFFTASTIWQMKDG